MEFGTISWLLLVLLGLFILQSVGGALQISNYRAAVRRVHRLGNVGIGQKRGRLLNGYVVAIACDSKGCITGAEIMDGISVLARFHPTNEFMGQTLIGNNVFRLLEMMEGLDRKKRKRLLGYARALEALEARLLGKEFTREQEAHMNRKRRKAENPA